MLGPEDFKKMDEKDYDLDDLIQLIDTSMKNNHGKYIYEIAIVKKELPFQIRNQIAHKYLEAGWKYVYHRTSSEQDNIEGQTIFTLSMYQIDEVNFCYQVRLRDGIEALCYPLIVTQGGNDFSKEGYDG